MRNKSYLIIIGVFLLSLATIGCSRYEEGPCLGMKSARHLLYGTYHVVYFSKNDVDITQQWKDSCDWTFEFLDDRNTREVEDMFYYEGKFFKDSIQYEMYFFSAFSLQDHYKSLWLSMLRYQIWPDGSGGNDSIGIYPLEIGGMRTFRITRLTETELWLKYEEGDDIYKIRMEELP